MSTTLPNPMDAIRALMENPQHAKAIMQSRTQVHAAGAKHDDIAIAEFDLGTHSTKAVPNAKGGGKPQQAGGPNVGGGTNKGSQGIVQPTMTVGSFDN